MSFGRALIGVAWMALQWVSVQVPVSVPTVAASQGYLLCAGAAMSRSEGVALRGKLRTRIGLEPGVSWVRLTPAGSRCLRIRLTARTSQRGNLAAAGRIGNVLVADSARHRLVTGQGVQLVCSRPGCAPAVHVGRGQLDARPPILTVLLSDRDTIRRSVAVTLPGVGADNALITYHLSSSSSRLWCSYTSRHVGQMVAVIVDKVVLVDLVVQTPFCEGSTMIIPVPHRYHVFWVAGYIKSGPLPLPLRLVHE